MKTRVSAIFLILLAFWGCSASEEGIKAKNTYANVFNSQLDGIQEDKLRQALESFYQGNYSHSLEIYKELIPSFAANDNQEAVINALFLMGACFTRQGKAQRAMEVYRLASQRLELILEKSGEKEYYRGLYFVEVGELLLDAGISTPEFTESFLLHGLKNAEASDSRYLQAKAYKNLGYFYLGRKNAEEKTRAGDFFSASFFLSKKLQNSVMVALSAQGVARNLSENGQYTDALEHFMIAYRVYQLKRYLYQQSMILSDIGSLYEKVQDYSHALAYYQRSFEMIMNSEQIENSVKQKHYEWLNKKITDLRIRFPDTRNLDKISRISELD